MTYKSNDSHSILRKKCCFRQWTLSKLPFQVGGSLFNVKNEQAFPTSSTPPVTTLDSNDTVMLLFVQIKPFF